jgi:hypothetical protein
LVGYPTHPAFEVERRVHDEGNCRVSRIWIRGSNVGVRIFAVGLLVAGLVTGLTAGLLKRGSEDTLRVRPEAKVQQDAQVDFETPPPDTDNPQPLPPGARVTQVRQEAAAEAAAKARAQAKADAARRAAKAKADAAKRAAEERASRGGTRPDGTPVPPGESPPPTPVDCKTYSGVRATGCSLLSWAGFGTNQMSCLDKLFTKESHWNVHARNSSSGAYGIPQALPGRKMATFGADWQDNAVPQLKWGLTYIKGRYSTPCGAWAHSQRTGWY